ncbi:MAG TPA: TolC family protein [Gemmataceae bacterium]|nr:TolC family protein [Gemmataceae bacterium]
MARTWLRVLTTGLAVVSAGCVVPSPPAGMSARGVAPALESSAPGVAFAEAAIPVGPSAAYAVLPTTTLAAPRPASALPPVPAAPDRPLTLDDLEQLAQAYNPILARDRAKVESARGQALQAGLYPNPHFDTNNPEVFAGRNSTFNVGFTQEVVVKGKLRLDVAAAEEAVRQAELTYTRNRLDLLTSVRRQYYTVLGDRRAVETLTELARIVREAAETGKKLEKAQETSKIDTLLLQVDAQQVAASLHQAELNYAADRKQLAAIVGVAAVERAEVAGDLAARRPDFDEELVRRYAVTGSTLVKVAEAEIARRRLLLRRAEVEPYPNVTLGPAYQFGVSPGSQQFWLTLQFPIPAWDRNQGNILAAVANVRDAETSLRVLQNDQLNRVGEALGKYLSARALVERYEADILPNVQRAQKLSAEGYAKGVFDFARYLQAQRTVVETNRSYTDALNSLWTAAVDLAGLLQLEHMP